MMIPNELIQRLNGNPFYQALGLQVEEAGDGRAKCILRAKPEVCWPFPNQPHGGVICTLMDTTMAWAVLSELEPGHNCTTIDLSLHFTAPPRRNYNECRAEIVHRTGRMCFTRGEILDREGRVLTLGQGAFRIVKADIF